MRIGGLHRCENPVQVHAVEQCVDAAPRFARCNCEHMIRPAIELVHQLQYALVERLMMVRALSECLKGIAITISNGLNDGRFGIRQQTRDRQRQRQPHDRQHLTSWQRCQPGRGKGGGHRRDDHVLTIDERTITIKDDELHAKPYTITQPGEQRGRVQRRTPMEYTQLGRTGLNVSVAGLGCGGNSRIGLGRGASPDECIELVRTAIDLGVNFLDTAEDYGTEHLVGRAAKFYDRDKLVISTKAILRPDSASPADVTTKVDAALKRLDTEYIDVFHFHAVRPDAYRQTRDNLAPALVRAKEQGKIRHIGITETGPHDPRQEMLTGAVRDEPWDVIMLAYSLLNQNARTAVFPTAQQRGIGTLLMFVVRNIFSRPDNRKQTFAKLVEQGSLPADFAHDGDPLAFLVSEGGAESIPDAAYRFARHQAGADVILFGTGRKEHVRDNVRSILRPPLDPAFTSRLHDTFGHLVGVGLDLPDRMLR